ncbi:IS66 family insertion sequence element accessory protein TnpA [Belliella pelovolcani]|uniref:IS66 family insertion sequence element accessory protein TnpA n=1 Tax=Belliella pelovolcani TaxID=529505 RepID=UPI00391AD3FD
MTKISNDEYYKLFTKWQGSGLSKAAFASEAGISRVSFYYWCRKFEGQQEDSPFASGFSLVNPEMVFQKEPILKINYPLGVSIEFFGKVDVESIKKLV